MIPLSKEKPPHTKETKVKLTILTTVLVLILGLLLGVVSMIAWQMQTDIQRLQQAHIVFAQQQGIHTNQIGQVVTAMNQWLTTTSSTQKPAPLSPTPKPTSVTR